MNDYKSIFDALTICEALMIEHEIEPRFPYAVLVGDTYPTGLELLARVRDRLESQIPNTCNHGIFFDEDCPQCMEVDKATLYLGDTLCVIGGVL